MGCRCHERKKDLNWVRKLAIKFSTMNKLKVQIYQKEGFDEIYYDFEPAGTQRNNIIEYINP